MNTIKVDVKTERKHTTLVSLDLEGNVLKQVKEYLKQGN